MTACTSNLEFTSGMLLVSGAPTTSAKVSLNEEVSIPSQANNFSSYFYSLISLSGMTQTPSTVSQFLKENFAALRQVQAVLAGNSADILHVWIMINEWTPDVRKQVYGIQKSIMKQLDGLNFDFYVVDLLDGQKPEDLVSDIPVIFQRAQQAGSSTNSRKQ